MDQRIDDACPHGGMSGDISAKVLECTEYGVRIISQIVWPRPPFAWPLPAGLVSGRAAALEAANVGRGRKRLMVIVGGYGGVRSAQCGLGLRIADAAHLRLARLGLREWMWMGDREATSASGVGCDRLSASRCLAAWPSGEGGRACPIRCATAVYAAFVIFLARHGSSMEGLAF